MNKTAPKARVDSIDDWQARDDFETLMRAKQIERDPARFKAAQAVAKARMGAVASIANKGQPKSDNDGDE